MTTTQGVGFFIYIKLYLYMYVYQDDPGLYKHMFIICKTFVNKLTHRFVDLQGFSGGVHD